MALSHKSRLDELKDLRKYWATHADALLNSALNHGGYQLAPDEAVRVTANELHVARLDREIAEEIAHGDSLAGALDEHPTD